MTKIIIINGPNLNLLGTREPDIYGSKTLSDIENECKLHAQTLDIEVDFFQSNDEGEIIDKIQEASKTQDGIIINAGAYTHTSVAIRDALVNFGKPVIEVHISNIYKREEFRHKSYLSDIASGMICGLGTQCYTLALTAIKEIV
ncbi:MAG: type II 3-dehydroquinate dehydratase [Rickettsiales bacterium]|nr:type II 3-dehydroquinate dehydratase [Pseudomonadota bacterium]MDA0965849.1 type II 3-dehydroquinate dehydratase [Pseudomonadota bacterium]MDG4542681.1 type II 3-dehydroquinate dehydratase [Rickettsiales bacterium]MDG4545185.1 type II 3-dehydroquinate dehydratase [Rickettsiales bacterium]MDG4547308.1 type II 3-dehydroquinate dehydratase [Rickettsiales bacterium]